MKLILKFPSDEEIYYPSTISEALTLTAQKFNLKRFSGHILTLERTGHVIFPNGAGSAKLS